MLDELSAGPDGCREITWCLMNWVQSKMAAGRLHDAWCTECRERWLQGDYMMLDVLSAGTDGCREMTWCLMNWVQGQMAAGRWHDDWWTECRARWLQGDDMMLDKLSAGPDGCPADVNQLYRPLEGFVDWFIIVIISSTTIVSITQLFHFES